MSSTVEYDLYQWMPGHGENAVATRFVEGCFHICIKFDDETGANEIEKTLTFRGVTYHSVGSFPGVGVLEKSYSYDDGEFESGCLKRLDDSVLSSDWNAYWKKSTGLTGRVFNHYVIFFTSENTVIHVVANDVIIC